ncbi:MAG TPA: 16S rRNA (guanine(527)-N(7))-methyltransferase RsmG [Lacipirellulaceae bacterium]|nr:16S rRNA (guanine(527)-N(7))-methyltransferase RsmG [Lacipirellulaceae bacterium]
MTDLEALSALVASHGIELEPAQAALLDRYRAALWEWNTQINLTRHTTLEKFVGRDVVDSWELAKLIPKGRLVLDIGAGGGVPGLVIAICRPDLRVVVCDSTQKKARVLEAIVKELHLSVEVFACRAEELLALRTFDVIVARAVAPLAKLLYWLAPHWGAFDELLAIKGRSWVEERAEARHRGLLKGMQLRKAAVYEMPGVGPDGAVGESVVLRVRRGADGVEDLE